MSTPLPDPPERTPRLRSRDVARREWYLTRLEIWLDDYPGRERRALVRQLRADLSEDIAARGYATAVAELGSPSALATSCRSLVSHRTRWAAGLAWATGFWALCLVITIAYTMGLMDAAGSLGGRAEGSILGSDIVAVHTAQEMSFTSTGSGLLWVVGIGVLIFLLAARIWRLIPALRPAASSLNPELNP